MKTNDKFDKTEHEKLRIACIEANLSPGGLKFSWKQKGDFRSDKAFYRSGKISMVYTPTGIAKDYLIPTFGSNHVADIENDIRSGFFVNEKCVRTGMETCISIKAKDIAKLHFELLEEYRLPITKFMVDLQSGLKYEIYAKEHPPPHFHVSIGEDKAVFDLVSGDFLYGSGKTNKLKRGVKKHYPNLRDKLLEIWNETRPSDCTVGPVQIN